MIALTADNMLVRLRDALNAIGLPTLVTLAVAVVVLLTAGAFLLRRFGKRDAATKVTALATLLGLGWSAQGMWHVAVHRYGQSEVVAWVLFVVFEAFLAGRMLRAHQYRTDYARRGKFITAVWIAAAVMALVVAFGEGLAQAPGRLAIPLLVAYGWYTDLTADDDPATRPKTSLRWTFRRAALAIGMIEPGERDAETIDRDRLRTRLVNLAFRQKHGSAMLNDLFRRKVRLAKLKTLADDDDIREVRTRLARMDVDLLAHPEQPARETHPVAPDQPNPPEHVQPAKPAEPVKPPEPARRPQGTHERLGRVMRSADLESDAVAVMAKSVTPDRPNGMSTTDLMALYSPPLGIRNAEKFAAMGRRLAKAGRVNGNVPDLVEAP